jgi:hypothetical protein
LGKIGKSVFFTLVITAALLIIAGCGEDNTIKYDDGSVYVGDIIEGFRNGQGTITLPGVGEYTGSFMFDTLAGEGKLPGLPATRTKVRGQIIKQTAGGHTPMLMGAYIQVTLSMICFTVRAL